MAGGGGRDRYRPPQPQKPPPGGPMGASPNSPPYVPDPAVGQKPQPQVQGRPPVLSRQGPRMSPPFVPPGGAGGAGGGMDPAIVPNKPSPNPMVDILQADPGKPMGGGGVTAKLPWQALAEQGMKGTGSAAGNRAAVRGLPVAGGEGSRGVGGIDGAIANLRQQLGVPGGPGGTPNPGAGTGFGGSTSAGATGANGPGSNMPYGGNMGNIPGRVDPSVFSTPYSRPPGGSLSGWPATGATPWNDLPASAMGGGAGPAYGPGAGSLLNPGNFGGPGSDLGFQSGGGLMGAPQQQQPPNPYLDILRQRLAGSPMATVQQATQFGTPAAVAAGIGRFAY